MNWKSKAAILVSILSTNLARAEDKWIAEEIFLQKSDMRKEVQQLKQQVGDLNGKLRKLEGSKKGVPLAASLGMILGKKSAPVSIMEFSDFECPYFGQHATKVLPKLEQEYLDSGHLEYLKRDFPLGFHSQAKSAAIAARCAGEQGKYWPMYNFLPSDQGKLGEADIAGHASKLGLKEEKFPACLADPVHSKRVAEDIGLGESLGVQGTPAFFLGRVKDDKMTEFKRLDGMQSFETLSRRD